MNNKELITGFIGGAIAGGILVWAYMYRISKIAFNKGLEANKEKKAEKDIPADAAPKEESLIEGSSIDPPKEKESDILQFIPYENNQASAPGPTDKEPYIITMEEADSDEVSGYRHEILYYIYDDGILLDSDGEEYTAIENVGIDNLDILGPSCEDIMIRNDENKTIYEVCISAGGLYFDDEE